MNEGMLCWNKSIILIILIPEKRLQGIKVALSSELTVIKISSFSAHPSSSSRLSVPFSLCILHSEDIQSNTRKRLS